MARDDKKLTPKEIVKQVLSYQRARTLWTVNYPPAISLTPSHFDLGAVLPAMLYMARFGHRRGKGRFVETFGSTIDGEWQSPRVADVAARILARAESPLSGFEGELGQAVLGDLLLTWCLENRKHAEGQKEQVDRKSVV